MQQLLVFPEHEAAGLLFIAEKPYSLDDTQIEWLCEASGEITLPTCEYIGIVFNHNVAVRREVLSKLDPSTIQLVYFHNPFELVFDELIEDLFELGRDENDDSSANDQDCELLASIHGLRALNISRSQISSKGLAFICELQSLESLSLSLTRTNDEDLPMLLNLIDLRELDLSMTMITDRGLATLAKMNKLQDLSLSACSLTDDALDELLKIPNLRFLDISDTAISDEGLSILQAGLSACQIQF
ncbi:MAG: hypothetical protein K2X77_31095 [Candidatus Obscuribacterales bacterium]|nr:hypothetical protein [Candidatus Obscuribacterales bacterium]